jgi:formylmethanofuran dehydrogenase subunit E-like metal-binding protein
MRAHWLFLFGTLLLTISFRVRAQTELPVQTTVYSTTPATPYTVERDSMQRRVARIYARTADRISQFRVSNLGIKGTRRKVISYARLKPQNTPGGIRYTRVKREINKHKTSGAVIEKRYYYGLSERLLLAEYYEQNQLVRLELREYPLRESNEYGTVFRTTKWVRGDYLHLTTYAQEGRGTIKHYYYTQERLPR